MRVVKGSDGNLTLDGDIEDGAEEAFADGRYIEAFSLLHAGIDWWMTDLYQLCRMRLGTAEGDEWHDMATKRRYRFYDTAEFLRDVGIITQAEFEGLDRFDRFRNKVVHRLVVHSYQPSNRNRVTLAEAKKNFGEGLMLLQSLRGKTGDVGLAAIFGTAARRSGQSTARR